MPRIAAVTTAVPPHLLTQRGARDFAVRHFGKQRSDINRLLSVFDHAGIESRYLTVPIDWFETPRSFEDKNRLYIEWSTRLGAQVLEGCTQQSGIAPADLTHIIFVSTSGLSTPSIDARLVNACGLSPNIVRTPVWGLGCAGGAAGVALAHRLARSDPKSIVMLVVVELCDLTFHFGDFSKSNFVATALFGDGAAGVIVVGDDIARDGPDIIDAQSTTWPDSLDVMGWNFDAVGMQVVFSRAIPQIVRDRIHTNVSDFLVRSNLTIDDTPHMIVHPGGAKVLAAYQETLALSNGALEGARRVLRDYGNMSAATVLFVLKQWLDNSTSNKGEYAFLTALGPGFTAENILLRS